jgi:HSP20 family protein
MAHMSLFRAALRPALPPPRLTADVYETAGGDAFVLEIPIPGLSPDEIVIEATSDSVTVSTRRPEGEPDSGRRYLQRELPVRDMSRVFEFPAEIDPDNIKPTLEHGILKVYVPRAAAQRRKVIKVA